MFYAIYFEDLLRAPFRFLGRSTPEKSSDRLTSKALAIFTSVAKFGVRLHCSSQP